MIRKMVVEDLEQVDVIEHSCFTSTYNKEQYLYELEDNPCAHLYVLETEGKVVGYIDYWITFDSCQLTKLAVDEQFRRLGYASLLMEHMIDDAIQQECEAILLEVRVSSKEAQTFYEQFEFLQINVRKGYYTDNQEDAIVMGKVIGGLLNE